MPLIRASAVCMGAPRPWQGFYNTTPEATLPEVRCPCVEEGLRGDFRPAAGCSYALLCCSERHVSLLPSAQDIEWMKGPEERQGKLQEKRTPLRDNYCEGKQPTEPKKVQAVFASLGSPRCGCAGHRTSTCASLQLPACQLPLTHVASCCGTPWPPPQSHRRHSAPPKRRSPNA